MRRFADGSVTLLLIVLALAAGLTSAGTAASERSDAVRGGTLRVTDGDDVDFLDTADAYSPVAWALQRLYSRTLYAYQSSPNARIAATPAPDLAAGPPKISADGRTYTFAIRQGVRWAPPVNRQVRAQDFV